jgi:hypothetical protein
MCPPLVVDLALTIAIYKLHPSSNRIRRSNAITTTR